MLFSRSLCAKMPGPYWKHQVNRAGSDLDDCRKKLDNLLKGGSGAVVDATPQEVFRNGNTVVEIAIKTKKDRKADKNEWRRSSDNKNVVKRTTVVEMLTEEEAKKEKWAKYLATGELPPRPGTYVKALFVKYS